MTNPGLTPLQERKLQARFCLLDRDDDGHLTQDDYAFLANAMADTMVVPADADLRHAARAVFTGMFDRLAARCGDDAHRVPKAAFLDTMAHQVIARPGGFDRAFGRACRITFSLGDPHDSGGIQRDAFCALYAAVRVPPGQARKAFAFLDTHDRGFLSYLQFHSACQQFYCGTAPDAPGNWLYGDF